MKISGIRLLGAMLCIAVSGVAAAQDASPIQISNAVFQEVEARADDGTVSTKLVPAAKVVPGGEVVYHIDIVNNGTEAATDVAIDNPVPSGLVLSSDPKPAASAVSVDGGETFGDLAGLTVTGADGEERAAQLTDVTNLRWVIATLDPGASTQVVFRARVR